MDYLSAIDISMSGMDLNRTKLDVIALNLANSNSVQSNSGVQFKPLTVTGYSPNSFQEIYAQLTDIDDIQGVTNIEIRERNVSPRMVHEPTHPLANEEGYVFYPSVNAVQEMTELLNATRAYEANVKALNSTKRMALKALEIGQ